MAITNPIAIKFTNEQLRPLCERLRNLYEDIQAMQADWNNADAPISALVPNDANEALVDGRDAEGVSRLDGQDLNQVVAALGGLVTTVAGAPGPYSRVLKACVRAAQIGG